MKSFLCGLSLTLACATAHAHDWEFLCRGYTISSVGTCFSGELSADPDGCDCAPDKPQNAPLWVEGEVVFYVEDQGNEDFSKEEFYQAAQYAADIWNKVECSHLSVRIGGTFPATDDAKLSTEMHGIYLVTSSQEWSQVSNGPPGAEGAAPSSWGVPGGDCTDRAFHQADILMRGWRNYDETTRSLEYFRQTLVHEMGHTLGLGHPCLSNDPECEHSCDALMAAGGSSMARMEHCHRGGRRVCDASPGQSKLRCDQPRNNVTILDTRYIRYHGYHGYHRYQVTVRYRGIPWDTVGYRGIP